MAKKKETDALSEIKNSLKGKKLVIGTNSTTRALRRGNIEKIFLSSNCSSRVKADFTYYGKIAGARVENLAVPNEELGIACRKQYPISVLGLLKK